MKLPISCLTMVSDIQYQRKQLIYLVTHPCSVLLLTQDALIAMVIVLVPMMDDCPEKRSDDGTLFLRILKIYHRYMLARIAAVVDCTSFKMRILRTAVAVYPSFNAN